MKAKAPQEHEELLTVDGQDFACLFRRDPAGGYLVTCEKMPPMIAYGETLAAARINAVDELQSWLDARASREDPFRELRARPV